MTTRPGCDACVNHPDCPPAEPYSCLSKVSAFTFGGRHPLEARLLVFGWLVAQHQCSTWGGTKQEGIMAIISRGFAGRRSAAEAKLPPGQYLTTDFPVLSAGPTPHISLDRWEFSIDDGSNVLKRWDWKSFRELPSETITTDLHCVTRWSKLGTSWEGVSLD